MINYKESTFKKLGTFSRHFLNSSVQLKCSNCQRNENIFSNENLVEKDSRNMINSSMTEYQNNPSSFSKFEQDDPDIVSRYRLALQFSSEKISKFSKKPKYIANNSFDDNKDMNCQIPWQKCIDFVNKNPYNLNEESGNNLYKINVRNNTSCDKNKENHIMFDIKYSDVLRSINLTKNRAYSSKK